MAVSIKLLPVNIRARAAKAIRATPARAFFFTEPRFVIVGSGRSGSGYIASLLREIGIKCGHETWWSLSGEPRAIWLEGDSSWIATFQLDGYKGRIFHQVRDPIKVMNSHYSDLVAGNRRGEQIRRFRSKWLELTGDNSTDVLRIYVSWIRQAEKISEWTWRLEDIDEDLLVRIAEHLGRSISLDVASRAIATVSRLTNRHADPQRQPITWEDLPASALKDEAVEIARHYGYL